MSPVPALELVQVDFGWPGGAALLAIDHFAVGQGECVFLRGPSGSGKSTLLALIGGVLVPSSGQVSVMGTDLATLGSAERDRYRGAHMGFIFQMFNLIPYLNVLDNVLLPNGFSRARRDRAGPDPRAEAQRLLGALGLPGDLLTRKVTQLSIGQQQRVAAARAMFGRPQVLIADEPTSALDADTRAGFMELLLGECRAQGSTLLFVSHDRSLEPHFDRSLALADINHAGAR